MEEVKEMDGDPTLLQTSLRRCVCVSQGVSGRGEWVGRGGCVCVCVCVPRHCTPFLVHAVSELEDTQLSELLSGY